MHVKKRGKFVIHRCHSISNENHIKIKHNLLQCFCNKLSPMNREFLLRLFFNLERVYFIFFNGTCRGQHDKISFIIGINSCIVNDAQKLFGLYFHFDNTMILSNSYICIRPLLRLRHLQGDFDSEGIKLV